MTPDVVSIHTALLSVSDTTGVVPLAKALVDAGVHCLATTGTAKTILQHGIPINDAGTYTGAGNLLDGRVKTLHPKIFAGILARRSNAQDMAELAAKNILPIDLVVVNLYDAKYGLTNPDLLDALAFIDIGGPSLIRAAAKNHPFVTVLTDPNDYAFLMESVTQNKGATAAFRRYCAEKAFHLTAEYDALIAATFCNELFPEKKIFTAHKKTDLRYGENPQQQAALYGLGDSKTDYNVLSGKTLSYNNFLDLETAYGCARMFDDPACAIVKHASPCGVATGATQSLAFNLARACDPVSAYGGVLAFNREVDENTAAEMRDVFFEVIAAPAYSEKALPLLAKKKKLTVIAMSSWPQPPMEFRSLSQTILMQTPDAEPDWQPKIVSRREPSPEEMKDLLFAWKVARWVKSNAVVFARGQRTLAIGGGQPSRVDAVKSAIMRAQAMEVSLQDTVLASDAFFPFADGVNLAAAQGVRAVIHPGGSIRDEEVIAAANQHQMAMVLTGVRHFRH